MDSYEKMIEKTNEFYDKFKIEIKNIKLAVASLTMAEYAKNYNDVHDDKIDNQNGLATVGDAICGAYWMAKKYEPFKTKDELTAEKETVTNENLNKIGEFILKDYLFHANNDLNAHNVKAYATAFEAFIGFIALNNQDDLKSVLDKYLK